MNNNVLKIMKHRIGVIVRVVLLLSVLAGCGSSTTQSTTATSNDFNGVNSISKKFANGLSLSILVNPQLIKPGYPIHIVITESNTLSKMNNLRASDKWPINGLSVGICGTESYPFGVAVFQGSYTATNVSSATPLELDNPNT